jgi:hypothetical protein
MMKYWYYVEGGKQVGPVSEAELADLLRRGRISANTLVWAKEMSDWTRVSDVPDFESLVQGVTPQPIPPPLHVPPPLPCSAPMPEVAENTTKNPATKESSFHATSFWPTCVVAWSAFQVFKRLNPEPGVLVAGVVGAVMGGIALLPFEFIYRRRWPIWARHILAWAIAIIVFVLAATA